MAEQVAILAGGCFWCTEAVFLGLDGVKSVESGYVGGHVDHPTYKAVCGGDTGHAEAIRITFDPTVISFDDLLDVHFATHDPTTLNRQGNDVGTQYRSAIYTTTDAQVEAAERLTKVYGDELARQGLGTITTEVRPAPTYYYAEDLHQQYLAKNPYGYRCHANTGVPFPATA